MIKYFGVVCVGNSTRVIQGTDKSSAIRTVSVELEGLLINSCNINIDAVFVALYEVGDSLISTTQATGIVEND